MTGRWQIRIEIHHFEVDDDGDDWKYENKIMAQTWPKSSSARTHPADQISIEVVYSVAPNISSGAR